MVHRWVRDDNLLMKELLRTNDIVFISWLEAVLRAEGIEPFVLDTHTSILEGSAGAIPRRVMVIDEDHDKARKLLIDAGEGGRVGPEHG